MDPFRLSTHLEKQQGFQKVESATEKNPKRPFTYQEHDSLDEEENPLTHLKEEIAALCRELLEKEKKEADGMEGILPQPLLSSSIGSTESASSFSLKVAELFELTKSEIRSLITSKETATTFILNGPQFVSSPFYGAKIIIQEFRTAPKSFNITFSANDQALTLFRAHAAELLKLFQEKEHAYSINRIDTALLQEEEERNQDHQEEEQ